MEVEHRSSNRYDRSLISKVPRRGGTREGEGEREGGEREVEESKRGAQCLIKSQDRREITNDDNVEDALENLNA